MIGHSLKVILFSIISSLGFTACSFLPATPSSFTQLKQVQNIDALPDTKTNKATLSQSKQQCRIQFTGYFEGGESTETWVFSNNKLQQAFSETYQYKHNSPVHLIDQTSRSVTHFDIQKHQVQENFSKLKSYFSQTALAKCS